MRILHTADWHLNASLGHQDLTEDICSSLKQIADYLDEYRVDVMLIAGDVFEHGRTEQMRSAVGKVRDTFLPFLEREGTIIAISGNHDNEAFFETLSDALDLVAPGRTGLEGTNAPGRLYVASQPGWLTLADSSGQIVQFVMMPYPTPRFYLRGEKAHWSTIEEKHHRIQQRFTETLGRIQAQLDPRLPSILVSHIHVRGAKAHPLYRLSELEDVIFETTDIPAHWAYVAYGHIHKPQEAIKGAAHIRYAGSIQPLDAGERKDEKSVALFEIGSDNRLIGEPQLLPLTTTPIYQIEITDPDTQLPHLAEQHPDALYALVDYTLHWEPGKHNRDMLCQRIQQIFPRWYRRTFREIGGATQVASFTPQQMQDVVGTVRDYLRISLSGHPKQDELLILAEELLAEEDWR